MAIDYSEQRVLLLESSGIMRATLKDMLRDLGFTQVKAQTLTRSALDLLESEDFSIILIGHNGNDKYSGLQWLEEARFRDLMKPTSSWVLLTSDASQQSLLFALEEEPDDILIKPFSIEELRQRLDILCRRRQALESIEKALARKAPNRAIQLCDSLFDKSHPYYHQAQLIKARLLMEQEHYAQAEPIFDQYYWRDKALKPGFYLAKCWFHQGKLVEAQSLLETLIREHPLMIAAYDLLALVHEVQAHLDEARAVIMEAVRRSPWVIQRQMEAGRILTRTDHLDQAVGAYRKAINLGEQSCHAKPEAYLRLANVYRLKLPEMNERERNRNVDDIERTLNQAHKRFPESPLLEAQAALMMSQVYKDVHAEIQAEKFQVLAQQVIKEKNLHLEPKTVLSDLLEPEIPVAPEYQDSKAETQKTDPATSAKVNRIGVRHYLAGKPGQAIRYFASAFEYDANNGLALLNLAQLFLEAARDNPERGTERLKMFDRYIRLADRLDLDSGAKDKLNQLKIFRNEEPDKLPDGPLAELLK